MKDSIKNLIEEKKRAKVPLLQIITYEEDTVKRIVEQVFMQEYEIIHYDMLEGFDVPIKETEAQDFSLTINKWMYELSFKNTVLVISNSNRLFSDYRVEVSLKKLLELDNPNMVSKPIMVILISDTNILPVGLGRLSTTIEIPYMKRSECVEYVKCLFRSTFRKNKFSKNFQNSAAECCLGLTRAQTKMNILESCYLCKDEEDILLHLRKLKVKALNQTGLISIEEPVEKNNLGGYDRLKTWVSDAKKILDVTNNGDSMRQILFPKGMLLVGVTGCGKSLCAKVSASVLGLPLLRIDFGNLMNKYVGETEKNLSNALQIAEAISPCVLWLDEFEKAFSSNNDSSGVSQRMLGKFLTWMQEHQAMIFTIATVNNVSKLPAELLRRGRFDKIYYVDLPNNNERKEIVKIHSEKLQIDISQKEIVTISSEMEGGGYSGADIEYILKEAKRKILVDGMDNVVKTITTCIKETNSISKIMPVEIQSMRDEFKARGFENVNTAISRR